jgi:hypothetical protein
MYAADSSSHPEGMPENSRGLRPKADTPGFIPLPTLHPEGVLEFRELPVGHDPEMERRG